MKLIIVESPSKAKTIGKYLGSEYKVLASEGHIRDLPEKRLGIDVDNNYAIEYVLYEDKKKKDLIARLKTEVKKSDYTYLATDPDREGEAISWHLKEVLGIKENDIRIEFNEITKKAVNKAIETPREINMNLVDAQQARRVMDRLVGYKLSPILSQKIKSGLSGGRVQSVALKMIIDREEEITNFKIEEYWNIFAMLNKRDAMDKIFRAQLNDIKGKKVKIDNKEDADRIIANLKIADYTTEKVKKSVTKNNPSAPFTTSTMQQDGSSKLGLSVSQIMQLAQQLYEGIDISGEGQTALVTYIRTDSVRVSEDAAIETKKYILENFGEKYAPSKFNHYAVKSNAQDAHEAIRPISMDITPDSLKGKINPNNYRLYRLIYNRFLASQMTSAEYDSLTVDINATGGGEEYGLKVKGKSLKFDGYLRVYKTESAEDDGENVKLLPQFTEGEKLLVNEIKGEQKFTSPPLRYTDSSIVKAMEENGIGRPSTYASILNVILKREYVLREEKFLKPTQLGHIVVEILTKYFPTIMNVQFTANMENQLDVVGESSKWQDIIAGFYPRFHKACIYAKSDTKKAKLDDEVSTVKCEKCGAMMIVKSGRFGKFLACPNFPNCKNTKPYGKSDAKCPKCGSDIYKMKTKTGKYYYSCSNYKVCDFKSWDLPADYFCPKCGGIVKQIISNHMIVHQCIKNDCDYKKEIEAIKEPQNPEDSDN